MIIHIILARYYDYTTLGTVLIYKPILHMTAHDCTMTMFDE